MDVWGWIAVYAVGLTLLQLLVYRYLLNSGGSLTRRVGTPFGDSDGDRESSWLDGSSRSPGDGDGATGRDLSSSRGLDTWSTERGRVHTDPDPDPDPTPRPPQTGTDGRPCRHCGAVNEADATFTRCWNCTREL